MMRMRGLKQTASCLVIAAMLPLSGVSAQESDDAAEVEDDVEEIVVTGIRGSLRAAVDAKKAADDIRDVINAEDVGKLPDTNIAEALQRITGVQISRDLGEGSTVAVRGMSQNRVEVNGQTQPGRGDERSVTFESLPASLFSSLEVIKTPSADEIEGALGAIIRLNTRKPLDVRKNFSLNGSYKEVYSERADAWAPNANVALTAKWEDTKIGDIGMTLSAAVTNRKLRQDLFETRGWRPTNGWGLDLDGDGTAGEAFETDENGVLTDLQDAAFQPEQIRSRLVQQNRENKTFKGSFQWRPSANLDFYLDLSHTNEDRADQQYGSSYSIQSPARTAARDYRDDLTVITADRTVVSSFVGETKTRQGVFSDGRGSNFQILGSISPFEAEITTMATGMKWKASERLDVDVEYSWGHGETFNQYLNFVQGIRGSEWPYVFYDFAAGNDLPTVIVYPNNNNGAYIPEDQLTAVDLLALGTYESKALAAQDQYQENTDEAFRIDFDYQADWGAIKEVEAGLRYAERRGGRNRLRTRSGALISFDDIAAAIPNSIIEVPLDNFYDGATGDVPRNWLIMNVGLALSDEGRATFYDFFGIPSDNSNVDVDSAPQPEWYNDRTWEYEIAEKVTAGYIKFNFDGDLGDMRFFGNFGGRFVHTKQFSSGYVSFDNNATFEAVEFENSYNDFLPSLNATLVVRDDLFLRFGAGKSMSRPRLQQLGPQTSYQFFSGTGNRGNPALQAEEATSLDLSAEYYLGEGGLLSVAGFYKNFSGSIRTTFVNQCVTLPVTQDDNTLGNDGCAEGEDFINIRTFENSDESIKLKGVEVGYQQAFTFLPGLLNGLGAQLNYTLTDSNDAIQTSTGFSVGRYQLSKHSYNAVLYYEKGDLSARAAYNWRSRYYDVDTTTNAAAISRPYGQLDLSLSYKLSKRFTLTAEALNFTNEHRYWYQEIEERWLKFTANDRRFQIGVRARF